MNEKEKERSVYRFANLSILQIMFGLAAVGLIATWALRSFFPN